MLSPLERVFLDEPRGSSARWCLCGRQHGEWMEPPPRSLPDFGQAHVFSGPHFLICLMGGDDSFRPHRAAGRIWHVD